MSYARRRLEWIEEKHVLLKGAGRLVLLFAATLAEIALVVSLVIAALGK